MGMEMDEAVWNHAVFSKNRERLLNEEIAEGYFQRVLERAKPHMSDEHFHSYKTSMSDFPTLRPVKSESANGAASMARETCIIFTQLEGCHAFSTAQRRAA
jgi:hypothetical protein